MYVVTGGAGFIGSMIVAGLAETDHAPPIVVDYLGHGSKFRNILDQRIAELCHPPALFDMLDRRHMRDITGIIHMGAISSTAANDVDKLMETNYALPQRLWRWCAVNMVPFIYASSAATYGDGSAGFSDGCDVESLAALKPLNAYAWSKHLFDQWVAEQMATNAPRPPQWVGLKFFNVYGPNEWHKDQPSPFTRWRGYAESCLTVKLYNPTHPSEEEVLLARDFVYVQDCVSVVLWMLRHPDVTGLFNVGSGQARTWPDVVNTIYDTLGKDRGHMPWNWEPMPPKMRIGYQNYTEADYRALRAVGYDAAWSSIEEGVADYYKQWERPI